MPPVAVVKLGSTSSTLLIAERLSAPVVRQQQLVNLLDRNSQSELLGLLDGWRELIVQHGCYPAVVAGGEALRLQHGLRHLVKGTFRNWWALNGIQEGRLAWMAVKAVEPATDVLVDIGGGSTEIVTAERTWSFPVGAARCAPWPRWPSLRQANKPAIIGGTAVALAAWSKEPASTVADVREMQIEMVRHPEDFAFIDAARRRLLPRGLEVLENLLEHTHWPSFVVSQRGLTEGLWLCASLGRTRA